MKLYEYKTLTCWNEGHLQSELEEAAKDGWRMRSHLVVLMPVSSTTIDHSIITHPMPVTNVSCSYQHVVVMERRMPTPLPPVPPRSGKFGQGT